MYLIFRSIPRYLWYYRNPIVFTLKSKKKESAKDRLAQAKEKAPPKQRNEWTSEEDEDDD